MDTPGHGIDVQLPIGYIDEQGNRHNQAVIRKMTGHEEALLYDSSLTTGSLVTELIRNCLVKLDGIDAVDANLVNDLYVADRNYLLMEIRRITLGSHMVAHYACPRCGADQAVVEDLGQIEVRRVQNDEFADEIHVQLEDGYTDKSGTQHTDLVLSLPHGTDEAFVAPMLAKDPLKALDALLLRCIKHFGTLSRAVLDAYGVKILRDLTMGDRQRLHTALSKDMPGMDLERSLKCPSCGARFSGMLDVSNFFVLGQG